MVTNYELRKNARAQLGGQIFANQWLMMLVACLLVNLINGAASSFVVGVFLVSGPLSFGLARVTTDRVKGKNVEIGDIFKGFTEREFCTDLSARDHDVHIHLPLDASFYSSRNR